MVILSVTLLLHVVLVSAYARCETAVGTVAAVRQNDRAVSAQSREGTLNFMGLCTVYIP